MINEWGKTMIRAAAILALLAGAACQRSDGDATSGGGMFGTGESSKNTSGASNVAASLQPVAPPPTQPPVAPPATPDPNVQAPSGTAPPVAGAQDRRLQVNNASGQTVTIIRGSAASDSAWGPDRIPTGVLRTGATVMVDFNDGNGECVYDLQATLQDGTLRVRRGVNVCNNTDWTITEDSSEVR